MRLSGCDVPEWMLMMRRSRNRDEQQGAPRRGEIDTTPRYDRKNNKRRRNKKGRAKKDE